MPRARLRPGSSARAASARLSKTGGRCQRLFHTCDLRRMQWPGSMLYVCICQPARDERVQAKARCQEDLGFSGFQWLATLYIKPSLCGHSWPPPLAFVFNSVPVQSKNSNVLKIKNV